MASNIKVGSLVRHGNGGVLCRVRAVNSDCSAVKLTDWAYGYNYIQWVSVVDLVFVGNDLEV